MCCRVGQIGLISLSEHQFEKIFHLALYTVEVEDRLALAMIEATRGENFLFLRPSLITARREGGKGLDSDEEPPPFETECLVSEVMIWGEHIGAPTDR